MVVTWVDQLLAYAGAALTQLRLSEQYPSFMTWARDEGASILGEDIALAQALAPLLWNQTPLKRLQFKSEPLAQPNPNDFCWCDSGRLYKHCCQQVMLPGPIPPHLVWMLSLCTWRGDDFVLALKSDQAPDNALIEAAMVDLEADQVGRAQQLLERLCARYIDLGKASFHVSQAHEYDEETVSFAADAIEQLLDLYRLRGFSHRYAKVVKNLLASKIKTFRLTALEQLMLSDLENDDLYSARHHFELAMRSLPDAPMLAYLETMLLMQEGEQDKAKQRARFWHRRLSRLKHTDPDELDFIRLLAADPVNTLASELIDSDNTLGEPLSHLAGMLQKMPLSMLPPLQPAEGGRAYVPSPRDSDLYTPWSTYTQLAEMNHHGYVDLWLTANDWMPALLHHPEWVQSPLVMFELGIALVSRFGHLPWMSSVYTLPLVKHLENWLTQIERYKQPLRWGEGENRVIYLLGIALISALEKSDRLRSQRLLERLYWLDDDDPLNIRMLVIEFYVQQGKDAAALALCERATRSAEDDTPLLILLFEALIYYRRGEESLAIERIGQIKRHNRFMISSLRNQASHTSQLIASSERLMEQLIPDEHPSLRGPVSLPFSHEHTPGSRAEASNIALLTRSSWENTRGALEWLGQW
ncbi:hypothetical protein LMG33818_000269 [Halomonadaceae bacterium LMG 33818]|uniref:SEC-C metal-binding domain-containing protein n=1 Tax=Cernens ardua TaxID=3402176 RepID=UPI003EDB8650